jgi:hypothetical protein
VVLDHISYWIQFLKVDSYDSLKNVFIAGKVRASIEMILPWRIQDWLSTDFCEAAS